MPTLRLSSLATATDPDALAAGWVCVVMEIIPGSDPHAITEIWADAAEVAHVSWSTSHAGRRIATPGQARKRLKVEIYVDGVLASGSPEKFWFAIRTSDMAVTIAAHIRLKSRFTKNKITTQIKIVR